MSPKQPNQQSTQQQQQSQYPSSLATQSNITTTGTCNSGPNSLMSTSLNSNSSQPPSLNVPPIMSTSLHSGSFETSNQTTNAGSTGGWSSASSLSPTIPSQSSQHTRKCEVKLNAMP